MEIDAAAILHHHLTLIDPAVTKLCKLYLEGPVFRRLVLYYLENWIENGKKNLMKANKLNFVYDFQVF